MKISRKNQKPKYKTGIEQKIDIGACGKLYLNYKL